MKELPVMLADDWTAEQQREFVIKDNGDWYGEWDWEMLQTDWGIDTLIEWGLEMPEGDEPFGSETAEAKEDDFDTTPPEVAKTVLGDLYEIGLHRLVCGDATCSDTVAKLMNGEKAEISFTSPPYNAGKTPTELKANKTSKYENDADNRTEIEYLQLLTDFTNNTLLFSDYSFVNIQSLAGNKLALIDYLYSMKSVYADTIIWQKGSAQPAMAENVLNSQFEYIHVFSGKGNRHIGTKKFRGTLSNVIEISKQTNNEASGHSATFSVDFAAHFVSNFCEKSVLDLFLGTGTTMVAAHQLKRKCYGCDLEPKYIDVTIKRMLNLDSTLRVKRNGVDVTEEWRQEAVPTKLDASNK